MVSILDKSNFPAQFKLGERKSLINSLLYARRLPTFARWYVKEIGKKQVQSLEIFLKSLTLLARWRFMKEAVNIDWSLATATAVKGLICYGCWASLDLPPVAFPLRLALLESSKVETTRWTMRHQAWWSAASVDHWCPSMWPVLRVLFIMFLWCHSVHSGLGEKSPQKDLFGRWWPPILVS